MREGKGVLRRIDGFFNGKGFYIVLFICAAVIGVSVWSLMRKSAGLIETPEEIISADVGIDKGISAFSGGGDIIVSAPEEPEDVPVSLVQEPGAEETALPEPEVELKAEPVIETAAPAAFVWPVTGEISMEYSVDYPVFNRTMSDWRTHEGLDIEAAQGATVLSCASGTVTEVKRDDAYGMTVKVEHDGGLVSLYAGLAETPAVKAGDWVSAGDVLGSVGNTAVCEISEPSHLHFAMYLDGESADPLSYLPER